eukprot:s2323_g17.t1
MHKDLASPWTPAVWKSYKLPWQLVRLGGRDQAMATAGGTIEWINLIVAEADEASSDEPHGKRCFPLAPAGYESAPATSPWVASPDVGTHLEKPILKQPSDSKRKGDRRVSLPPDAPNGMAWGRAMIDFRMHCESKISYEELRGSIDARAVTCQVVQSSTLQRAVTTCSRFAGVTIAGASSPTVTWKGQQDPVIRHNPRLQEASNLRKQGPRTSHPTTDR